MESIFRQAFKQEDVSFKIRELVYEGNEECLIKQVEGWVSINSNWELESQVISIKLLCSDNDMLANIRKSLHNLSDTYSLPQYSITSDAIILTIPPTKNEAEIDDSLGLVLGAINNLSGINSNFEYIANIPADFCAEIKYTLYPVLFKMQTNLSAYLKRVDDREKSNRGCGRLTPLDKQNIDGIISYQLDAIVESGQKIDPNFTIKALDAITAKVLLEEDVTLFKRHDILDSICQIREILNHPCPQNRRENYPYFAPSTYPWVVIYKDKNNKPAREFRGLLGLTKDRASYKLYQMNSIPQDQDIAKFKNNYIFVKNESVKELFYVDVIDDKSVKVNSVKIIDTDWLEEEIEKIALGSENEEYLYLSDVQIENIITSNGGHIPSNKNDLLITKALIVDYIESKISAEIKMLKDNQNPNNIQNEQVRNINGMTPN